MIVGYVTLKNGKSFDYPDIVSIDTENNINYFDSKYERIRITYNDTGSLLYPVYKTMEIPLSEVWLIGYYGENDRIYRDDEGAVGVKK
jgi:hypothetical protein